MSEYGYMELDSSLIAKEIDPKISWKITAEPSVEPITLVQLKQFARIDGNFEDDLLNSFIKSARFNIENYTNLALITQTIEMYLDYWPSNPIELPRPPLISITSIKTLDESNTETAYSSDNYFTITNSTPAKLVIKNSVTPPYNTSRYYGGYKITYTAGYGSTASYVPNVLKDACKQWATIMYETRNLSSDPPPQVKTLIDPFKVYYL